VVCCFLRLLILVKFEGGNFLQAAYVAFGSAEFACEKCLNEISRCGRTNCPATHTDNIHAVILNSLFGREVIMNQSGTNSGNLV